MTAARTRLIVERLLTAIESRDLRAINSAMSEGVVWQNVPSPPAFGRRAVVAMLAPILTWSDTVRWDVESASHTDGVAWVERTDRFWIDGAEHAVSCNGVFTIDVDAAVVTAVRDYVDLGEWRQRIEPVLQRLAGRSAHDVVTRHLDAVASGDPVSMTCDYALDAELHRGDDTYRGWYRIADYFSGVPTRLADRRLTFGSIDADGSGATVEWQISDDRGSVASGRDTFRVEAGRIAHQTVVVDGDDF